MLRRFTSALMALLLLGATLAGAATRRDERECRMPGMHDCCKKARASEHTPEVAAARLCCLVNCTQPAPTGTSFTFRSSSDARPAPRAPAAQTPGLPAV